MPCTRLGLVRGQVRVDEEEGRAAEGQPDLQRTHRSGLSGALSTRSALGSERRVWLASVPKSVRLHARRVSPPSEIPSKKIGMQPTCQSKGEWEG